MNYTKRLFSIILLSLSTICLICPNSIKAENTTAVAVTMQKQSKNPLPTNEEIEHEGRRMRPRPIYCTISPDGINVAGVSEEIISYEVWDEVSGICVASFFEESDFLNYLFSQSGEFQLIFVTENHCISGYISIY